MVASAPRAHCRKNRAVLNRGMGSRCARVLRGDRCDLSAGGLECQDVDVAVTSRAEMAAGGGVALRSGGMAP